MKVEFIFRTYDFGSIHIRPRKNWSSSAMPIPITWPIIVK